AGAAPITPRIGSTPRSSSWSCTSRSSCRTPDWTTTRSCARCCTRPSWTGLGPRGNGPRTVTLHNPVTQVVLPLFVIAVMFALGTTLTHEALTRVLRRPRGFVVGVLTHALLLPLLAFALAIGLGLPKA